MILAFFFINDKDVKSLVLVYELEVMVLSYSMETDVI